MCYFWFFIYYIITAYLQHQVSGILFQVRRPPALISHLRLTVLQVDVYNKLMQLLVLKLALTDCWLYLPGINILKVIYKIVLVIYSNTKLQNIHCYEFMTHITPTIKLAINAYRH